MDILKQIAEHISKYTQAPTQVGVPETRALAQKPTQDLTHIALQHLEQAMALNADKTPTNKVKIKEMLPLLQKDVNFLYTTSQTMEKRFRDQANDSQKQLDATLLKIGELVKSQNERQKKYNETAAEKSGLQAKVNNLKQQLAQEQIERDRLKEEVDEANSTRWYQYLMVIPGWIIKQIENAVNALDVKEQQLADLNNHIEQSQIQEVEYDRVLQIFSNELDTIKNDLAQYAQEQKTCEINQKTFAKRVAFSMNITAFYLMLKNSIEGIGENLERLANVARRLNETIDYYKTDGRSETITTRAGLLRLAEDADTFL